MTADSARHSTNTAPPPTTLLSPADGRPQRPSPVARIRFGGPGYTASLPRTLGERREQDVSRRENALAINEPFSGPLLPPQRGRGRCPGCGGVIAGECGADLTPPRPPPLRCGRARTGEGPQRDLLGQDEGEPCEGHAVVQDLLAPDSCRSLLKTGWDDVVAYREFQIVHSPVVTGAIPLHERQ